jgi:hypothetical protein
MDSYYRAGHQLDGLGTGTFSFSGMSFGPASRMTAGMTTFESRVITEAERTCPSWTRFPTDQPRNESIEVVGAGWPFRALRGTRSSQVGRSSTSDMARLFPDSWTYRNSWRGEVPVIPIWPGFLGNSFLYAFLGLVAIRTPRILRRSLRRLRNLCLSCGYSREGLGEGSACPECGKALT